MSRTSFTDAIAKSAAVAAGRGVPLVITEFNSALGMPEGQDGVHAAAFVAHTALFVQDISNLDVLSFWTFTDVRRVQWGPCCRMVCRVAVVCRAALPAVVRCLCVFCGRRGRGAVLCVGLS